MDMRDQYGNRVGQVDAYGNPIQQYDAYGNPITTPEQGYGQETAGYTGAGGTQQPQMAHPEKEHRGGVLHRSGSSSSSSSSSEDDGMGGRRKKKGLKEKIKEKLPGGHKTDEHGQATTGEHGHEPEKKGMMEKIKEKLPGHH